MPNVSAALFIAKVLDRTMVQNKRVLDVGSCNYNGSVGALLQHWQPAEYIGVDIEAGPGVDLVCRAEELVEQFGPESFDVIVCVEMLEHAERWRESVINLKRVLKRGGLLAVTTRSRGYPCHGFPNDFWRFEEHDFNEIFSDLSIIGLEKDNLEPGIFIFATKPEVFCINNLDHISLYSIPLNERVQTLPNNYTKHPYYKKLRAKQRIKQIASDTFMGCGKYLSILLGIK